MSFGSKGTFISAFPIGRSFLFHPCLVLSCLTVWTKSPSTVLNGERGHPCHVSSLREKVCSFSASRMNLVTVFGSFFFTKWMWFPFVPSLHRCLGLLFVNFLSWKNVVFCQALFLHLLIESYDFSPLAYWCDRLHHLIFDVEAALHTWNKSHCLSYWGFLRLCLWELLVHSFCF